MSTSSITRGSITLPNEVSNDIWAKTIAKSFIMDLASRTSLDGKGKTIPLIASDPEPAWVTEGAKKANGVPTLSTKVMTPYTLALIVPFSNQFKRDYEALYNEIVSRVPKVLAKKIDRTAMGFVQSPGTGFDTLASAASVSIASTPAASLLSAETDIEAAGYEYDHIILAPQGNAVMRGALDTSNRPLYTLANGVVQLDVDTRKNANVYDAGAAGAGSDPATPQTVGLVGDFSQMRFGVVENIKVDMSDQATVGDINLFEQNMFALRFEIECGIAIRDLAAFKKLTIPYSA